VTPHEHADVRAIAAQHPDRIIWLARQPMEQSTAEALTRPEACARLRHLLGAESDAPVQLLEALAALDPPLAALAVQALPDRTRILAYALDEVPCVHDLFPCRQSQGSGVRGQESASRQRRPES
jgi:hypothetical protein